jgi:hypothetical protein
MVVTTTTHRSDDPQVAQTSNRLWMFLVGVGAALAAGLFILGRRSGVKAR